ncbi:MAG: dienelactone hydrolase family protein [Nitriliruptorales bacterium]
MDSHLRRYLAEEVALDHAEGLLSRREALRHLALMGFSALTASTLLAACARDDEPEAPQGAGTEPAGPTGTAGANTETVSYPGPSGTLRGAWAPATPLRGGVVVIHENRGLTDHIRSVGARLAGDGYASLAPDLLSQEGGTDALGDPANVTATLSRVPPERFIADLRASLDELARRVPQTRYAAIGFCFGGGLTWSLLAAGEPRLAAAIPFYGPTPPNPDFSRSRAAILGIYAERDTRVNATQQAAKSALERAGLTHEIRTFPGVDHAFFNDTGPRYDPSAATAAYQAVLDWLERHVVTG